MTSYFNSTHGYHWAAGQSWRNAKWRKIFRVGRQTGEGEKNKTERELVPLSFGILSVLLRQPLAAPLWLVVHPSDSTH